MASANIAAELRALPLEYVISAPMTGAIKAQAMAARSTINFIEKIGLKKIKGKTQVNMIDFIYSSPHKDMDMSDKSATNTLSVPLLSIIPVPFIRIKDMNIKFDFKIVTTAVDNHKDSETVKVDASYGMWFTKVKVHGVYTSSNESRSSVDKTGTIAITVNAVQDEMPAGLKTVLSIFNTVIQEQSGNFTKSDRPEIAAAN